MRSTQTLRLSFSKLVCSLGYTNHTFIPHLAALDLFTTTPALRPVYPSVSSHLRVTANSAEEWMVVSGLQFVHQHNRKHWGNTVHFFPCVQHISLINSFLSTFCQGSCLLQNSRLKSIYLLLFKGTPGLPWWRSGWECACQCRGHGFEPWSGKIPHAAEQLGPWATITEPALLEPVLCNKRGHDSERPAHRDEEWPPFAATRESPCTETKTQHSQK